LSDNFEKTKSQLNNECESWKIKFEILQRDKEALEKEFEDLNTLKEIIFKIIQNYNIDPTSTSPPTPTPTPTSLSTLSLSRSNNNTVIHQSPAISPGKQKPTKFRLRLLPVQGQINPDLFTKFQNYISQISEIELSQEEGITCFVSVAVTERVEQYFTSCNITSNTIPITLQRRNTSSVPGPLKDPWGNMVVVFFNSSGQFDFKEKDSLIQNARKIQQKN